MGSGPFGYPRTLKEYIGELFDEHGPVKIMRELAQRLGDEAGIAHGEGRDEAAAAYGSAATDLRDTANTLEEREDKVKD